MQTNYKTSLGRSMKILQVFALITICSCTFSCTDDPDPATPATPNQPLVENPPINDNPAPTLDEIFDDIQGAWELKNIGFSSEFGANARTKGEFFDPFIEFLKDSTFLIIDSNENGFRGKYKLKEDVIELLGFGTIEDYSVENDRLIPTIKKEMGEESFNIEATKVAEPDIIDEKTEKLVGEWYMVEEI